MREHENKLRLIFEYVLFLGFDIIYYFKYYELIIIVYIVIHHSEFLSRERDLTDKVSGF